MIRYWHTLKYLKPIQVYSRAKNMVWQPKMGIVDDSENNFNKKIFRKCIDVYKSCEIKDDKVVLFTFLNQTKSFNIDKIDWEYNKLGKLWQYNLNYFEFLLQDDVALDIRKKLLYEYCKSISSKKAGIEPYPTSLRLMNALKFLNSVDDVPLYVFKSLFRQAELLSRKIEYHLLGNHILENGFALLFAGVFYNNELFKDKGSAILKSELKEQIMHDGGHFELSPMYHQIILFRILDTINLLYNEKEDRELITYLIEIAKIMLSWINQMTFSNGENPFFNDTAIGIAPTTAQLNEYSNKLGINNKYQIPLGESGYRWFNKGLAELVVDVGKVGPDYQPGHAHADTLSFEMALYGQRVFVNSGTSLYEVGDQRDFQRSTKAHNTVVINNQNSSDTWGGFRVARRIKNVDISEEHVNQDKSVIKCAHDGYSGIFKKISHVRKWELYANSCKIKDLVIGSPDIVEAYFYLHPTVEIIEKDNSKLKLKLRTGDHVIMEFLNYIDLKIQKSSWFPMFGIEVPNTQITVSFKNQTMVTNIFWGILK